MPRVIKIPFLQLLIIYAATMRFTAASCCLCRDDITPSLDADYALAA